MCGVTESSCGRWFHMERDPTGRCPTRMWVNTHIAPHLQWLTFSWISSALNCESEFSWTFLSPLLYWSQNLIFCPLSPAGDQSNRRGLPSSRSDGLSCGVAPAHAGLLGEGTQRQAKVWTDCHNPGQAHQKPSQPERAGQQLSMVSGRTLQIKAVNPTLSLRHAWSLEILGLD